MLITLVRKSYFMLIITACKVADHLMSIIHLPYVDVQLVTSREVIVRTMLYSDLCTNLRLFNLTPWIRILLTIIFQAHSHIFSLEEGREEETVTNTD
jgi:hypothetical protein